MEPQNEVRMLAIRRIQEQLDRIGYTFLEILQGGSCAVVYKAIHKETEEMVAVKQITVHEFDEEDGVQYRVLREIALLKMLEDSPHIVNLLEARHSLNFSGQCVYYLVFEYMEMSLKQYIKENENLSPFIVKLLMYQLCEGVSFLHNHSVMHRDLKPENLLFNSSTLLLKISDFGFSRQFTVPTDEYSLDVMSESYRAPELLLLMSEYTVAVDMWSVGCIFGEIVTNKVLFKRRDAGSQLECIFRLLGTPNEQVFPEIHNYVECGGNVWNPQDLSSVFFSLDASGVDLMSKMLEFDSTQRISAQDAMLHSYFDECRELLHDH